MTVSPLLLTNVLLLTLNKVQNVVCDLVSMDTIWLV